MRIIRNILMQLVRFLDKADFSDTEPTNIGNSIGYGKVAPASPNHRIVRNIEDMAHGTNMVVYNATGGKIVQVWNYDHKVDRHVSNLYIITENQDFGEELALIMTKEALAR